MTMFTAEEQTYLSSLPVTERSFLLGTLFLYVFRGTDQKTMRAAFKASRLEFDFLAWRRCLHSNGALLRDGKVAMYRRFAGSVDTCKRSAVYGLSRRDWNYLELALKHSPLVKRLSSLHKEGREPLSVPAFDKFCTDVLTSSDLLTYIRKYVRRKMGFLVRSYGRTFQEMEMDLLSWAHYSLLKSYPRFDDVGHGIAIAKTTVKNRGVNLILSMTSAKQNELITDENGACERTTVSLSSVADGTGQFLTADGTFVHRSLLVVGLDGVPASAVSVDWETQQAIKQLLTSGELNSNHKRFLGLMLGNGCPEFSEWLGAENSDAIEQMEYSKYMLNVCKFMGVPPERANTFLKSLRVHLGAGGSSQYAFN